MIVLYVYTVQQNNNIFLLISLNPTLVVCPKKSVSFSVSVSLTRASFSFHSRRGAITRGYSFSTRGMKSRKEGSPRSRGKLVPKIVTCKVRSTIYFFQRGEDEEKRGHLFSLLVGFCSIFFFVFLFCGGRHTREKGDDGGGRGFVSRNFFFVFCAVGWHTTNDDSSKMVKFYSSSYSGRSFPLS